MIFNDERVYKTLKKVLMYVFPAILFVWDRLVEIWSIPYGTQISGTILLCMSDLRFSWAYQKANIIMP